MNSKVKSSAATGDGSALVPDLRFPEFREAIGWRITKLNTLLFEAKHRNRSLELGPEDVLSVSGEYGCVNQIEFMGRSYAGASVKDYHVVERGDIVYTKSPLKKNPYGIIKENKGKRGIVSTLYAVYRPFTECSSTYLDHFFSLDFHLNSYLQPIVRKGAKNDMKVNNADVLKGDICVPDLPEQQKIADCLDSADALIAAQGRKVEALRAHKKALMQQLFPHEGETQPRLRFPEFQDAGAWESVSLGSVASISTKKVGDKTCVPMSITSGVGLVSQMEKFGRIIAGDSYKNYLILKKNDFAYNKSATKEYPEGFIALYTGEELAAVPNSIFTCFRVKEDAFSPRYLNYLFLGNLHGRWLRKFIEVGARTHGSLSINDRDFLALPVAVPGGPGSLQEQEKIADCLTALDDHIAAEARKLDRLKTHKKGLMQQLFPHVGECDA